MTRVNIEIDSELHKKAKLNALLHNKTLIQYINEALKEKVEKEKKKGWRINKNYSKTKQIKNVNQKNKQDNK